MDLSILIIFLIAAALLTFAIIIETLEYRKYRTATYGVIALGESMSTSFGEVAAHLNRFQTHLVAMGEGLESVQQEVVFMKGVLGVHSEKLSLTIDKVSNYDKIDIGKIQG